MPRPLRVVLAVAFVGYLACVAYLVWTPAPSAPGGAVRWLSTHSGRVGLTITPSGAEFLLNVVMLVPFGLLGGLALARARVLGWTCAGFVLSVVIEVGQALVLPTRTPSVSDVVANTLGAFVGAVLLAAGVTWWGAARAPHRVPAEAR